MLFYLFNFLLTTLQSQLLSSLSVKVPSTESTVGTESERNCSFILSDFATATFTVNAESAKCIKHSKEYCCWTNFDRCLLTNFVHLLSLSWGNDVLRHILCVDFLCNFSLLPPSNTIMSSSTLFIQNFAYLPYFYLQCISSFTNLVKNVFLILCAFL